MGYCPWGHKESNMTEQLNNNNNSIVNKAAVDMHKKIRKKQLSHLWVSFSRSDCVDYSFMSHNFGQTAYSCAFSSGYTRTIKDYRVRTLTHPTVKGGPHGGWECLAWVQSLLRSVGHTESIQAAWVSVPAYQHGGQSSHSKLFYKQNFETADKIFLKIKTFKVIFKKGLQGLPWQSSG